MTCLTVNHLVTYELQCRGRHEAPGSCSTHRPLASRSGAAPHYESVISPVRGNLVAGRMEKASTGRRVNGSGGLKRNTGRDGRAGGGGIHTLRLFLWGSGGVPRPDGICTPSSKFWVNHWVFSWLVVPSKPPTEGAQRNSD
ncbi:unnamed protein product [Pleuronectes platessa]|uniref:Uncharacterized protein n=1 Tax=Pleuronectes platessa TaxID=8262 RepID=A0A9N7YZ01_PLEPL|nr:unnamed protein product [Pleuronectes platessa]